MKTLYYPWLIIILCGTCFGLYAQQPSVTWFPRNYITQVQPFEGGIAWVKNKVGLHGYINYSGKMVIPFAKRKLGTPLTSRLIRYYVLDDDKKSYKTGLVSPAGNILLPADYAFIRSLGTNACAAIKSKTRVVLQQDKDGEYVKTTNYTKQGAIDRQGKVVLPPKYEEVYCSNQLIYFSLKQKGVVSEGVANAQGKIIISPLYTKTELLKAGIIAAQNTKGSYLYNAQGKLVLSSEAAFLKKLCASHTSKTDTCVARLKALTQHVVSVKLHGKYAIAAPAKQQLLSSFKYSDLTWLTATLVKYKFNQKYGLMNARGQEITPPIYNEVSSYVYRAKNQTFIKVKKGDLTGIINAQGKVVFACKYYDISHAEGDVFHLQKTREISGAMNTRRRVVLPFKVWDNNLGDVYHQHRLVYLSRNKYQMYAPDGKPFFPYFLTDLRYDKVNQVVLAQSKQQAHLLDGKTFKKLHRRKYSSISKFVNGLAIVRWNNKEGIINTQGKELVLPAFEKITPFGKNAKATWVTKNGIQGILMLPKI